MKALKQLSIMLLLCTIAFSCKKGTTTPDPTPVTPTPTGGLTVTAITPDYGKAGVEITVTGTGFSTTAASNTVTVGGKAATVTSATATTLKITAPADGTHGAVEVKSGGATVAGPTFYYEPEVTSLNVTTGKSGDVVIITGKNFGTAAVDFEVKFNGVVAEITAATATTLTVKVPATATTGTITVARKTKAAINGPAFTVTTSGGGGGAPTGMFTVTDGSITFTSLVKYTSGYSSPLCFTIDQVNNFMYVGTINNILKIDLNTNALSSIMTTASFVPNGSQCSAMDVGPDGKLYLLVDRTTVFGLPANTSNVYYINTATNTATMVGTKFIGLNIGGAVGDNVPFMVNGSNEFFTIDGSLGNVCKYTSDLSTRTSLFTANGGIESFHHMMKKPDNSLRIMVNSLLGSYYYDYAGGALSTKTTIPTAIGTDMLTVCYGGSNAYEMKTKPASDAGATSQHAQYTIGKLNAGFTDYEKKATFTIDRYFDSAGTKVYSFIGLNGKTFFYADKNGNMYALILSYNLDGDSGIYKMTMN